ncbi:lysozyme inhibitor LprI family protein [Agrobacterium bohemicum]|uniref:Lysozyme inhibitor LprI-like N-terminal domain-containing protein n=1 Tax=Agrobacterium bohemicum TaxID=2052828 RepID=A0A135P839_9HYPH|nr:lysozyme inhibitor LprI family protein [Agrobacterium bohemicum]KXG87589.1 hypothetical protein ATO67_18250 [Agrobacterium bohemicum]
MMILALVCPAGAANAQGVCGDAANQRAINECYGTLYKQADSQLQATYDSLRKKLTPEAATRLRDAQRAWVAYKENWCALQSSTVENGSMYPSVLAQCLTQLTNEQLERLTYQNTCVEDVDCWPKR